MAALVTYLIGAVTITASITQNLTVIGLVGLFSLVFAGGFLMVLFAG